MNDFIVMIQTALETKGIKSDYNEMKKWLEKDPAKINAIMDMSATKTEINKFIKEFAPQLQKMFSDLGVKVNLKDIESSMKSVFKESEKAARQQQKEFEKMRKDELRAYIDNEKLKQDATKQRIKAQQDSLSLDVRKSNTKSNIDAFLARNTKMTKELRAEFLKLKEAVDSVDDSKSLSNVNKELGTLKNTAKATGQIGMSMGDNFKEAFEKFSVWVSASAVFFGVQRVIKNMVGDVKDLNDSLVELQKVSDLTGSSLDNVVKRAYDMGSEVARTGKEVIDATTVFKRAGYTLEQSLDMAKASLVMVNVGDGIRDVGEASSALIATLKGFKLSDTDAMSVIDMINETSNNAAIDFDNITEGLRRVSGTLSQTGTSIQQTIGLLTGGFGSLRDIEMVSSGKQEAPYVQKCA